MERLSAWEGHAGRSGWGTTHGTEVNAGEHEECAIVVAEHRRRLIRL